MFRIRKQLLLLALLAATALSSAWAYKESIHIEKDDLNGGFYYEGKNKEEQIYERYDNYGNLDGYDTPDGPVWKNSDGTWDTPYGEFIPDKHGGYEHKDGYLEPDGNGGYYFHKY